MNKKIFFRVIYISFLTLGSLISGFACGLLLGIIAEVVRCNTVLEYGTEVGYIVAAVTALGIMLLTFFHNLKAMIKEADKASQQSWKEVIGNILGFLAFLVLLGLAIFAIRYVYIHLHIEWR